MKDVAELMVHDLEEGRIEPLRIIDIEPVRLIERDLQPTFGRTESDGAVAVPRGRADDEELTGGRLAHEVDTPRGFVIGAVPCVLDDLSELHAVLELGRCEVA